MNRNSNTLCEACKEPLYRRPRQLLKQQHIVCTKCRTIANSSAALIKANRNYKDYIVAWKAGIVNGMRGQTAISAHIRKYLKEKYNNQCCKCGWAKVHPITGKIPLEVNHIDGDHTNNNESNLELLCPNCHALTPTYRALNKGNGRPR